MEDKTEKAIEILKSTSIKRHNLLELMSDMIIIDEDTLPVPKEIIDRGTVEIYLDNCEKYIKCHTSKDFKIYRGISPENYPQIYEDTVYCLASLCYFITDCSKVENWSICRNHKDNNG